MSIPLAQVHGDNSKGSHGTPAAGQLVPSVGRAVQILEALAAGPPTATLAALSRRLAIPRSSALALCNTLVRTGLMNRESDGSYRLGPGVVALGRAYLTQTDLHTEFARLTRRAAVLPEETLLLSVRDGSDVVYIGHRIGRRPVAVSYDLGLRLPAHCTASGKALLAALPPDELRDLYPSDERLPSLTPQSITKVSALVRELAETKARGYAVDDEELAPGMMCVGVAVPDRTGHAVGAVAVGMVKAAMADGTLTKAVSEMQQLADSISLALGATVPASQTVPPSS